MAEPIRKLGRFELLRSIAKGGMGEIYLARQRGTAGFEKSVIIKTILPHLAEEEEFVEKFLDEGRIVVQLIHGNIVPVFDMDEENGEYYIAMEYIPGRDLREVQKRLAVKQERMPIDLALFITQELCKGLDYAHRKTDESGESLQIVHRDVSPSNVLVSREGEVKIIDFGIARAASRIGKTVSGRIQGKFCYMSPEQASGGALDGRSDLFSAGVVLYEMLTGFRPFEGDSDLHTLDLVRKCEFEAPSTLIPTIPEEVDKIVARALGKDPNDRYESADQFQVAILQFLYRSGSSGPTSNDLAGFLSNLFPDGLERDDLRSARDSSPPKNMSLDDAMDFELAKLSGAEIDPLNTTAISSSDAKPKTSTPTLAAPDRETPGQSTATEDRPIEVQREGRKRTMAIGVILGVLGTIAISVYLAMASPDHGEILIESDPAGAEIQIDGATLPGAKTPYTATLPVGTHDVMLTAADHQPKKFKVEINASTPTKLAKRDAVLDPVAPPAPRKIKILTIPNDAELSADGVAFGIGEGILNINPGEEIRIEVTREGCTNRATTVPHSFASDTLEIKLTCQPVEALPKEVEEPKHTANGTTKKVTFTTNPSGAEITVNGSKIGKSPVVKSYPLGETLEVKATLDGYRTESTRKRVKDVRVLSLQLKKAEMGCLNVRLGFPAVGRISIDGTWLPGELGKLQNHPLSAGKHTIRVKNDATGKDETFPVEIAPGPTCTLKFVWPR